MAFPSLIKLFGRKENRPDLELAQRLEKLLRDIERPKLLNPSKFWYAKEVQKAVSPLLLTIPFEQEGQFVIVWAQNRTPYGLMLFSLSKWPNVDYDLWAYTREQFRGQNIAKLTLVEGLRQLALQKREAILTAEILIDNERTREGSVRWLKVLGFIPSENEGESSFKSLYIASYTKEILQKAFASLPSEYQTEEQKMSPLPPDILTNFASYLTDSFNEGGSELLDRRRTL
jgi:hypothetical protein